MKTSKQKKRLGILWSDSGHWKIRYSNKSMRLNQINWRLSDKILYAVKTVKHEWFYKLIAFRTIFMD